MAIEYVYLGAVANDGTGDKLRTAGGKINDNFLEIEEKALTGTFQIIRSLSDLPTPVADVITLLDDTTYYFITNVDLLGNALVIGENTALRGASSNNSGLYTSVPSSFGAYMLSSANSVDILNMNFDGTDFDKFINFAASDTNNVFFNNCTINNFGALGNITGHSSAIITSCTFNNCGSLDIDGVIGTLAFDNCLGIPNTSLILLNILSTCTITRRFRIIYSSFICNGTSTGINVNALATIPDESYILDTVNFSGSSSTYISGVTQTSNKALFINCRGITNTAVIGQAYMQGNVTATVIAAPSTFVKVLGTTTAGPNNSKYLHASNRLTCDAAIERKFLVICQLSFTSGNNQTCEFGFYDSTLPGVRVPSRTTVTTNGAGIVENVSFTSVISHKQGNYIEIHCANNTSATNITVTSMNFIITEIK